MSRSGTPAILMVPVTAGAITIFSFSAFMPRLAIVSVLLGWTMLVIAVIDAKQFIIPDVLSLPAIPAGLIVSGELFDPLIGSLVNIDNVIGALAGGASLWIVRAAYFSIRRREGLGLGDVKLASVAGAWTGWQGLSLVLLLASLSALTLIMVLTMLHRQHLPGTAKVPFGTFLAPSIWMIWSLDAYGRGL